MHRALIEDVRERFQPARLYLLWTAASAGSPGERFARQVVSRWERAADLYLEHLGRLERPPREPRSPDVEAVRRRASEVRADSPTPAGDDDASVDGAVPRRKGWRKRHRGGSSPPLGSPPGRATAGGGSIPGHRGASRTPDAPRREPRARPGAEAPGAPSLPAGHGRPGDAGMSPRRRRRGDAAPLRLGKDVVVPGESFPAGAERMRGAGIPAEAPAFAPLPRAFAPAAAGADRRARLPADAGPPRGEPGGAIRPTEPAAGTGPLDREEMVALPVPPRREHVPEESRRHEESWESLLREHSRRADALREWEGMGF